MPKITIAQAEKIIGCPSDRWAGNCHLVSSKLAPQFAGSRVQRGYYVGETDPKSFFGERKGFFQHSWVRLKDGRVLDGTRFAFKGGKPAIWIGEDDGYDVGGSRFMLPMVQPPPGWMDDDGDSITLDLGCVDYVANLLRTNDSLMQGEGWIIVSTSQLFWLANLPVLPRESPRNICDFFVREIYEAIIDAGKGSLIPIDRRTEYLPAIAERSAS